MTAKELNILKQAQKIVNRARDTREYSFSAVKEYFNIFVHMREFSLKRPGNKPPKKI